jgi:murein DD-endopeptidase MepM/ murein hydrolase activator NlpD
MNPQTLKLIVTAFSMKKEIKLLFFTVAVICILPVFTVILITQAGINMVSDVLASINPITSLVEIHNPADGSVIESINEPRTWPTTGYISQEYGAIDLPYQPLHTGIDIANPNGQVGDPVGAFMKGKVIYVGETATGFGKHVKIDHGYHIVSIYGHLDSIAVTEGQEVDLGTIIGTMGSTGWSTGPHLHLQINVFGIPVNPRIFLEGNPEN